MDAKTSSTTMSPSEEMAVIRRLKTVYTAFCIDQISETTPVLNPYDPISVSKIKTENYEPQEPDQLQTIIFELVAYVKKQKKDLAELTKLKTRLGEFETFIDKSIRKRKTKPVTGQFYQLYIYITKINLYLLMKSCNQRYDSGELERNRIIEASERIIANCNGDKLASLMQQDSTLSSKAHLSSALKSFDIVFTPFISIAVSFLKNEPDYLNLSTSSTQTGLSTDKKHPLKLPFLATTNTQTRSASNMPLPPTPLHNLLESKSIAPTIQTEDPSIREEKRKMIPYRLSNLIHEIQNFSFNPYYSFYFLDLAFTDPLLKNIIIDLLQDIEKFSDGLDFGAQPNLLIKKNITLDNLSHLKILIQLEKKALEEPTSIEEKAIQFLDYETKDEDHNFIVLNQIICLKISRIFAYAIGGFVNTIKVNAMYKNMILFLNDNKKYFLKTKHQTKIESIITYLISHIATTPSHSSKHKNFIRKHNPWPSDDIVKESDDALNQLLENENQSKEIKNNITPKKKNNKNKKKKKSKNSQVKNNKAKEIEDQKGKKAPEGDQKETRSFDKVKEPITNDPELKKDGSALDLKTVSTIDHQITHKSLPKLPPNTIASLESTSSTTVLPTIEVRSPSTIDDDQSNSNDSKPTIEENKNSSIQLKSSIPTDTAVSSTTGSDKAKQPLDIKRTSASEFKNIKDALTSPAPKIDLSNYNNQQLETIIDVFKEYKNKLIHTLTLNADLSSENLENLIDVLDTHKIKVSKLILTTNDAENIDALQRFRNSSSTPCVVCIYTNNDEIKDTQRYVDNIFSIWKQIDFAHIDAVTQLEVTVVKDEKTRNQTIKIYILNDDPTSLYAFLILPIFSREHYYPYKPLSFLKIKSKSVSMLEFAIAVGATKVITLLLKVAWIENPKQYPVYLKEMITLAETILKSTLSGQPSFINMTNIIESLNKKLQEISPPVTNSFSSLPSTTITSSLQSRPTIKNTDNKQASPSDQKNSSVEEKNKPSNYHNIGLFYSSRQPEQKKKDKTAKKNTEFLWQKFLRKPTAALNKSASTSSPVSISSSTASLSLSFRKSTD